MEQAGILNGDKIIIQADKLDTNTFEVLSDVLLPKVGE